MPVSPAPGIAPPLIVRQAHGGLRLAVRVREADGSCRDMPVGRAELRWQIVTSRPAQISAEDWGVLCQQVVERPVPARVVPASSDGPDEPAPTTDAQALHALGAILNKLSRQALAGTLPPLLMRDARDMALRSAALLNSQLPSRWQAKPEGRGDGDLVVLDVSTRELADEGVLDLGATT